MSNRYAVLIGSSTFPEESKLTNLICPTKDVEGLLDILKSPDRGSFTEIKVLKNEPFYMVIREIQRAFNKARKEDLVLIYYSGHGKLNRSGKLFLTTADTVLDELESTSVSVDRIREFGEVSSCRKVVIILDCCFGGAVGKVYAKGSVEDQLQLSGGQGTYIMTASTEVQSAEEKEGDEYSVFTKHMINGILSGDADLNGDGFITLDELYDHIYRNVSLESPQKPTKWGIDLRGEIVLSKSGKSPRTDRRKNIRKILIEWANDERIPDSILSDALSIIKKPLDKLNEIQLTYDRLMDELLKEQYGPGEFVHKWTKIEAIIESEIAEKKLKQEAEAQKKAEEDKQLKEEAEAQKNAEEDKRLKEEAEARKKAEEDKRLKEEAEARKKAEEDRKSGELAQLKRKEEFQQIKGIPKSTKSKDNKLFKKPYLVVAIFLLIGLVGLIIETERKNENDRNDWNDAQIYDSEIGYNDYIQNHPKGRYVEIAEDSIESKKWSEVNESKSISLYYDYLNKYPYGKFSFLAREILENVGYEIFTDPINGDQYSSIKIGDQTWMAEDLKAIKFNDGTDIPYIKDCTTWESTITPAYSRVGHNNSTNVIYNWYAVNTRKLCPAGWHVPNIGEVKKLGSYLGGVSIAGRKLKESGNVHWSSRNESTNETGFSAIGVGEIKQNGMPRPSYNECYFWTSSEGSYNTNATIYYLFSSSDTLMYDEVGKKHGLSVRCIKNTSSN